MLLFNSIRYKITIDSSQAAGGQPVPAPIKPVYRVQAGAYVEKSNAEELRDKLEKIGIEAVIVKAFDDKL